MDRSVLISFLFPDSGSSSSLVYSVRDKLLDPLALSIRPPLFDNSEPGLERLRRQKFSNPRDTLPSPPPSLSAPGAPPCLGKLKGDQPCRPSIDRGHGLSSGLRSLNRLVTITLDRLRGFRDSSPAIGPTAACKFRRSPALRRSEYLCLAVIWCACEFLPAVWSVPLTSPKFLCPVLYYCLRRETLVI